MAIGNSSLAKMTSYLSYDAVRLVGADGGLTPDDIAASRDEYLSITIEGNANRIVPWSDPQIPFECDCGQIIYADTVHECG